MLLCGHGIRQSEAVSGTPNWTIFNRFSDWHSSYYLFANKCSSPVINHVFECPTRHQEIWPKDKHFISPGENWLNSRR